jgi:cell shape-determining protein MreC
MTTETQEAEWLWQRDAARARVQVLEAENRRLRNLLGYAEQAIKAEYDRANEMKKLTGAPQ